MVFSYKELHRLANLPSSIKINDVTNAINSIGFEVEETYPFAEVSGIKFGKVLELSKNPNADKLTVCKIKFNDKERVIQTNATNMEVGKTVIAFVPGSKIGNTTFSSKELKGVVSEGMLSSLTEFGISKEFIRDEHGSEIMFYDVDDLTIDPVEYLGLNDIMIDIDILSNRADAQSYLVMARELSAFFGVNPIKLEKNEPKIDSEIQVKNGEAKSLVMIEATDAPRISLKEQVLLAKNNIKSINDIVDLTNLTLIMCGQPTHAYDKRNVSKDFKASYKTGKYEVFGDTSIEIENGLVIESNNEVVSIAGIIGMNKTGVLKDTNDFVLELGRFNAQDIRNTAKQSKLATQASIQSAKNIGLGTTGLAIEYLSSKLRNFSMPINFQNVSNTEIEVNEAQINQVAGFKIFQRKRWVYTKKALEILGFKFVDDKVIVPAYRFDVISNQDLQEEIFRFFGYDHFEPQQPKILPTEITSFKDIKSNISSCGFNEVTTYSLISKEKNIINPFGFDKKIELETFVSKEREVIRSSQAVSLIEVIEYNQKRKMADVNIFSHGMIGQGQKTYALASTALTFKEMKRHAVNILPQGVYFERLINENLHPGVSAKVMMDDQMIGWIGKVHPRITNTNAFILEVFINESNFTKSAHMYDHNPLKTRDVTFELLENEEIGSKIKDITAFSVDVIDVFKTENTRKVTIRITATDEEIKEIDRKYN